MSTRSRTRTTLRLCCCLAAFAVPALDPIHLRYLGGSSALAGDASVEKEAFEATKELGTVEAWDAFLSNYPKGFHADLARAYVKKLAGQPAANTPRPGEADAVPVNNDFPVAAGTWGGIVRSGPGQSYKKQTSLAEGEPVSLMGVAPELDNGYPWFKIWYGPTNDTTGYMWGGILCAKGVARPDVYQMCPAGAKQAAAKASGKASGSCETRGNEAENTVCGNSDLLALDAELNLQFNVRVSNITSAANGGTEADVAKFRDEQRDWLRQRNACGGDAACLASQYNARLKVLRELNQPE